MILADERVAGSILASNLDIYWHIHFLVDLMIMKLVFVVSFDNLFTCASHHSFTLSSSKFTRVSSVLIKEICRSKKHQYHQQKFGSYIY